MTEDDEWRSRRRVVQPGDGEMSEEEIDYNVMGSFPASDPPAWTLGLRPRKKSFREFEGEAPSVHDPTHQNEPTRRIGSVPPRNAGCQDG